MQRILPIFDKSKKIHYGSVASDPTQFWSKVDRRGADECWPWRAYVDHNGYGRVNYQGTETGAHRISWALTYGPIPPGLFVCHTCDNPRCVNPSHLFVGTTVDNQYDSLSKGRDVRSKRLRESVINEPWFIENAREVQALARLRKMRRLSAKIEADTRKGIRGSRHVLRGDVIGGY